ncbi:ubiquitin-associated domain-containing protein 1-like [Stylonychia lemnae]|uniref:Ubiquitin-associated domain-containing protein 1-like n=1 Tax=Stylonychia lemnae TaxID=5949 RepID=A0A078B7D1_STYLE|nr:ubiquitin-associated domain-containing protein 1-like [Stylonychia lemnae]|eukprot:CDW90121.1 ubiquitin-associated domain-containing protein 1-like [Stylonychia lemnae]
MPISHNIHNRDSEDDYTLIFIVSKDQTLESLLQKVDQDLDGISNNTKVLIHNKLIDSDVHMKSSLTQLGIQDQSHITLLNHNTSNGISCNIFESLKIKIGKMNKLKNLQTRSYTSKDNENQDEKITPELIGMMTDADKPLMPHGYFLKERLNNLINMLENELIQTAALDLRVQQEQMFVRRNQFGQLLEAFAGVSNVSQMRTPPRLQRERLFSEDHQQFNQSSLLNQISTEANQEKVIILKEMGFNEDQAKSALIRFRNNLDQAMNYLLSGEDAEMNSNSTQSSVQISQDNNSGIQPQQQLQQTQSQLNEDYVSQLMDMGFGRQEVISALRLSRNDYELACDYLLNSESRYEEPNFSVNYPSQEQIMQQSRQFNLDQQANQQQNQENLQAQESININNQVMILDQQHDYSQEYDQVVDDEEIPEQTEAFNTQNYH